MNTRRLALFGGLLLVSSCGSDAPVAPATNTSAPQVYLDQAIDIMQQRGFYRRRVDWTAVRAAAHTQAATARTTAETYPAIRTALLALGDHHSFLSLPLSSASPAIEASAHPIDSIGGELLNGRFGYVHVPTFSGTAAQAQSLIDSLHKLIRVVDASNPCGWVVDLRRNRGGNMWPMLAGVGPILGNDRPGYFIDADSNVTTWFYQDGASGTISASGASSIAFRATGTAYVLKRQGGPVAVLTDSLTASSGEAITVAFRGMSRARSFGGATAGVPTANAGFPLSDGATIFLMVALDADRNKTWYSTRIPADENIPQIGIPRTDDATVVAGTAWLAKQTACSTS